ncbi:hypothetical protein [Brevibacterium casei]
MNDDELQEEADRLDEGYGIAMAYYGHLASLPDAAAVNPQSPLATHNRRFTDSQEHLNPTYLAWRALASASEHAGFAEHMRYVTSGGVVVRPQTTLARATLLGAARALYVLEPDGGKDRSARAAKLANQESKDAQRMLDVWNDQTGVPPEFLADLEQQTNELAGGAAKILTGAGFKERTSINESEMLTEVAPRLSTVLNEPESKMLAFWNRASGVSHARSWTWNTPHGRIHPQFDFIDTWAVPIELLAKAWELWNRRRGVNTPSALPTESWMPDRDRWGPLPTDEP